MYSVTKSFGLNGLRGFAVAVEADVSGGLPAFSIVCPVSYTHLTLPTT